EVPVVVLDDVSAVAVLALVARSRCRCVEGHYLADVSRVGRHREAGGRRRAVAASQRHRRDGHHGTGRDGLTYPRTNPHDVEHPPAHFAPLARLGVLPDANAAVKHQRSESVRPGRPMSHDPSGGPTGETFTKTKE